jgi:hypothetical protein
MAQTTGFVQKLTIDTSQACAFIGTDLPHAEVLVVNISSRDDAATVAFQTSIIDTLAAAMSGRRTVVAGHGDQSAIITGIAINPA